MLTDCTTEVKKGEVIVVCGPSGSGKSTLIKCVNALEPFQKGDIVVDNISVGDPKTDLPKLRARVGMVYNRSWVGLAQCHPCSLQFQGAQLPRRVYLLGIQIGEFWHITLDELALGIKLLALIDGVKNAEIGLGVAARGG